MYFSQLQDIFPVIQMLYCIFDFQSFKHLGFNGSLSNVSVCVNRFKVEFEPMLHALSKVKGLNWLVIDHATIALYIFPK